MLRWGTSVSQSQRNRPGVLESHLSCTAAVSSDFQHLLDLVCPMFDPSLKDTLPSFNSKMWKSDFQKALEAVFCLFVLVLRTFQSALAHTVLTVLTKAQGAVTGGVRGCCPWPWSAEHFYVHPLPSSSLWPERLELLGAHFSGEEMEA